MFDCQTNRAPIEWLGSIGFWFGFARLATPGKMKDYGCINLYRLCCVDSGA